MAVALTERISGAAGLQPAVRTVSLDAWFGATHAVRGVSLEVPEGQVTAIIGPSGCGKSTLLRCLNRIHETVPGARVRGDVWLAGQNIYAPGTNPIRVRRLVGMVFQRPTPFPTMSIRDNVAAGLKVSRSGSGPRRSEVDAIVERALRRTALWEEVKDRLAASALALSGGQQQRLCIARTLAINPDVILMDEPASALDPISTLKIEDLMRELVRQYTIIIVTHNMQQAARVSDQTVFFSLGEQRMGVLVEASPTRQLFTNPADQRTEDYITGRFG